MRCSTSPGPWCHLTVALALAGCALAPVQAQAPGTAPTSNTGASTGAPAKPPAAPSAPRQRIELPAAERKALEERSTASPPAEPTHDELVPSESDMKSPAPAEEQTRIEQIRTLNGVSEIRVTPALTGRTYTIVNREGRQPTSATGTSSGLSVPMFFNFQFGRTDDRPAAPVPPPPTSATPR